MFSKLPVFIVALGYFTSALVIPRDVTVPSYYNESLLESYDSYRTRYVALNCAQQHNTTFFDQCCHPLLTTQNLSDRPAICTPSADALSSASSLLATPTITPTPSAVVNVAPSPSAATVSTIGGDILSGFNVGSATYFYQNGNPGACGTVHSDSDLVVALDTYSYGDGENCGRKVKLVNKTNGKSVEATVADKCPTCISNYSVDCSLGTFLAMSELSVGIFDLAWDYVD